MEIIKLDAIDSTNSFLKELAQNTSLKNFTTVVAKQQLNGRGQMHTQWLSEANKNLLFSCFYSFQNLEVQYQFYLNYAVSLSIFETLKKYKLPNLAIKWPNDILSEEQKICGVLIENSIQSSTVFSSIIGIGLNVNQTVFSSTLTKVTSIKKEIQKNVDLDLLLKDLLFYLKKNITLLIEGEFTILKQAYLAQLYKKNIVSLFKDNQNRLFLGKIIGVSEMGKLEIELENKSIVTFGVKEVSFE
ncbi:biotin--[acetyl-CoA-carboxylase] ligase [Tenacibaculum sp. UWU-22]|uniref:biotin--[acetyl-CoA-carboxylase] ligase n=1 Tax=Tenacibaculum sp. UWU-22 TaxID=3234187 RepID=UPI0034DB2733